MRHSCRTGRSVWWVWQVTLALENPFAVSHEAFFCLRCSCKGSPWSSFSAVWVTPCNTHAQPATLRQLRLWSPEKTERQREQGRRESKYGRWGVYACICGCEWAGGETQLTQISEDTLRSRVRALGAQRQWPLGERGTHTTHSHITLHYKCVAILLELNTMYFLLLNIFKWHLKSSRNNTFF